MGANAQTSVPKFSAGEVLTAANQNISAGTGVPVFVSTATRDAAFGGTGEKVLDDGQFCYLEVAPKRFQVYNVTGWQDWFTTSDAFTPTWTNLTVGNGTVTARYVAQGPFTFASINFVFGSTSSISGTVSFTLPNTANTNFTGQYIGQTRILDASFGYFSGTVQQLSGTAGEVLVTRVDATYATDSLLGAAVPMTWASTDQMWINLVYMRPQ
jgi:hypothetical protein